MFCFCGVFFLCGSPLLSVGTLLPGIKVNEVSLVPVGWNAGEKIPYMKTNQNRIKVKQVSFYLLLILGSFSAHLHSFPPGGKQAVPGRCPQQVPAVPDPLSHPLWGVTVGRLGAMHLRELWWPGWKERYQAPINGAKLFIPSIGTFSACYLLLMLLACWLLCCLKTSGDTVWC